MPSNKFNNSKKPNIPPPPIEPEIKPVEPNGGKKRHQNYIDTRPLQVGVVAQQRDVRRALGSYHGAPFNYGFNKNASQFSGGHPTNSAHGGHISQPNYGSGFQGNPYTAAGGFIPRQQPYPGGMGFLPAAGMGEYNFVERLFDDRGRPLRWLSDTPTFEQLASIVKGQRVQVLLDGDGWVIGTVVAVIGFIESVFNSKNRVKVRYISGMDAKGKERYKEQDCDLEPDRVRPFPF